MLTDHSSSVLLDSVNDTTFSPIYPSQKPRCHMILFFLYFPHTLSHPHIYVSLQFSTCLLVHQFNLPFLLTYVTSIVSYWSLNSLFRLVPELTCWNTNLTTWFPYVETIQCGPIILKTIYKYLMRTYQALIISTASVLYSPSHIKLYSQAICI